TIPLTPIQEMFFERSYTDPHHYNQAVMFYTKERLAKEEIKAVFKKIQEHHDALRMTYEINRENGEITQINHGVDYPLSLEEFEINESPAVLITIAERIQTSIDLEKGPLMKLGLFHLNDGDRLLIAIHHLVIDGVSWRILFADIETLYNQIKQGKKLTLPPKTDSFKTWSEKLTVYANSKEFLKEKTYWQKIESQKAPLIVKDFDLTDNYIKDTVSISYTLGKEETGLLLTKVNMAFGTEINDILLTALAMGIKKTFGCEQIAIALEGHGREEIIEEIDISRTVGWFTSLYPVMADVSYADDLTRQIKEIKETLRQISHKGIGFGILKYLTSEEHKKEIEFKLTPQISFNYLGQFDTDVKQLSFLKPAKESPGPSQGVNNKREYLLDISGITVKNRLTMSISYNKTHFKQEIMSELNSNFQFELERIISFCAAKEKREFTSSDFTYKGLSIESVNRLMELYPDVEDIYTLTPMQEGMLYHALADESSYSYFEQISYHLQSELDIYLVEKSLHELFKRHAILRTAFVYKDIDRPVQLVLSNRTCDFYYQDLSYIKEEQEKMNFIRNFKKKDIARSFILSKDVLMRVSLSKMENAEYELTWSFHHILMDGWCSGILNTEFFEIYTSYLENRPYRLPEIKPYQIYIQWLEKQDKEESRLYWENYLAGYEEHSGVPVSRTKPKEENDYQNEIVSLSLDIEKTGRLNELAAVNHVTMNTLVQTLWGIMLGKYNGQEDIVFGAVVSGRPTELPGVESMIGLFINTIPVRICFAGGLKFNQLLRQIQQEALASEPFHYHPLAEIQSYSSLKQNLINHIMIFENYPISQQIEGYEKVKKQGSKTLLKLSNISIFEQTNYDFNVSLSGSLQLKIKFEYNGIVYDRDFVEQIGKHFILCFEQVIKNQELEIRDITFLTGEEKNRILYEFNDIAVKYPKDKTIHQLFGGQAERIPDNIALVGSDEREEKKRIREEETNGHVETLRATSLQNQITYRQLNQQSDRLAMLLIEKGIQADIMVAIMIKRSVEMIIGILGILKSGGAYLPIDPEYPQERIDYMLKDSNAAILLTLRNDKEINCQFPIVKSQLSTGWLDMLKDRPRRGLHYSNLAYIIYTSGTTGQPKGSLIEHRNVVRLLFNDKFQFDFTNRDVWTLFHSFCFDFSVWEMYGALLYGAKLVIVPKMIAQDTDEFLDIMAREKVSVLNQTPSAFYNLIDRALSTNQQMPLYIRYVIFGGEALNPLKLKVWLEKYPSTRLINMFGITETTVHVTYKEITHAEIELPTSNIGKPIPTLCVYILDRYLKLVPLGVSGEICVGGKGVCRGYLNKVDLTGKKFIENPYNTDDRLYRSGDIGRFLVNGDIEYLGRIDQQVKIRGFRIELGEIENRLSKHPGIKQAVVLTQEESGDKYLCAYIVSIDEKVISGLREYLSKGLPDYMIPSYFVPLEKIPLTPNGKIDRKALPKPELKAGDGYMAPRNEIERKLVDIWSEVLERQAQASIGINDNFFQLGGHSLKATILISKIHKELNVKIPIAEIFKTPSIRLLSEFIKKSTEEKYAAIEPTEEKEYYVLSPTQKRLYILQQLATENTGYNMPYIIPFREHVEREKLESVFKD
ncbi:MAG: amino acid adenylation domain-containing protein, partial [Acidobacteria bacterium]|nr:amino acid adenylation domain-containing protein [Acidobacteriota bacterium]